LVDAFDRLELTERTIFVFTTDNGTMRGQTGVRNGREIQGAKAQMREAGVAMPFIVRGSGLVPEGVVTDALTDFTDILPTFAELAGTQPSDRWVVEGQSIAPLILGKANDSSRDWIYAQGGHPADFRDNRVVPSQPYDDRVIRDKRWKLWVSQDRKPIKLYDMQQDPRETNNLIDSDDSEAQAALQKLWSVIEQIPKTDNAPRYEPNPVQPWDRFEYAGGASDDH
jgi:arylsulfatase A-like enzyme